MIDVCPLFQDFLPEEVENFFKEKQDSLEALLSARKPFKFIFLWRKKKLEKPPEVIYVA